MIFFIALGVRVAYFIEMKADPEYLQPSVDAYYHDYWAWGLASGDWRLKYGQRDPEIQSTPYFRAPAYPYMLSVVYTVFGHDPLAPRLLQHVFGALNCFLIFFLARRLFGNKTALLASFMYAVYWPFVYFEGELREVTLLCVLLPMFILLVMRLCDEGSLKWALLAGLTLGVISVTRANYILFFPFSLVWLYMFLIKNNGKSGGWKIVVMFSIFVSLPISVVAARNYVYGNDFVLVSSNMGINLYIGNNNLSDGHSVRLPGDIPIFRSAFSYLDIVEHVEEIEQRDLQHSEVSQYFSKLAVEYIIEYPFETFVLGCKKMAMLFGGTTIESEKNQETFRRRSVVLSGLPLSFSVVLSFSIVGVLVFFRRVFFGGRLPPPSLFSNDSYKYGILVLLLIAVYCSSYFLFFVTSRFRVPCVALIMVFSAYGANFLLSEFGMRNYKRAIGASLLVVLFYFLSNANLFDIHSDQAKIESDRGLAYARENRFDDAIESYQKAIEINPSYGSAYNNLATALAARGDLQQATVNYIQASQLLPNERSIWINLGLISHKMEMYDTAIIYYKEAELLREDEMLSFRIAYSLLKKDDNSGAEDRFKKTMESYGRSSSILFQLGRIYLDAGKLEDAKQVLLEALQKSPNNLLILWVLTECAEALHDIEGLHKYIQSILALEPGNAKAIVLAEKYGLSVGD
ncbi:hypothetical protein A9Q99_03570 [Gammaproteobacteria bacterium 45_16_T64]|nr:hypothetical protein A9Q99_03570 [Gammaproteobacteria bacterium 45_16_T64]